MCLKIIYQLKYNKMERKGIIYRAFNLITGKSYIGQTRQPLSYRRGQHYSKSKKDKLNNKFYNALRKYKKEDWIWTILIETEEYKLNYYEKHFIKEFGTFEFGYNGTFGGNIEGENHPLYSNKIYHLYKPDCGEIFLTRCELIKIHKDFTNILLLESGKCNQIKGYILAKNKEKYELLTNQIKYKFYNSDFGVIEGTTKELSKQFNYSENGFQRLIKKKVKLCKGWVLYENKDKYFELVPKNKKYNFKHEEYGVIYCKKEYLMREFNLKYTSVHKLISGENKILFGWTVIKD